MTGYVINYLTADSWQIAVCLTTRKTNGRMILTPRANACCEFLNWPKPLMCKVVVVITVLCGKSYHCSMDLSLQVGKMTCWIIST